MNAPFLRSLFPDEPERDGLNSDLIFVNLNLIGFGIFGILVIWAVWWGRCSVALLWACASAAVGFIVGFLFGFPRTIAQPVSIAGAPAAGYVDEKQSTDIAVSVESRRRASRLAVNTNLEQVSDWITKTIVGVGLVELRSLPRRFGELATYASSTLGRPITGSASDAAAAALIAYFAVLGFLGGYLITRMFFQVAFDRVDGNIQAAAKTLRSAPLVPSIGSDVSDTQSMVPGVSAAAQQLKDIPLGQAAAQGADSAVVARANLFVGSADKAVVAYRDAIAKDPWNTRLRIEYASALRMSGAAGRDVISVLRDARAIESQKPDLEARRTIYESLTYLCLYESEPQGFTEAISYGEDYVQGPNNLPSKVIWVNLASGYGQQARWMKKQGDDFTSVRNKALEAAEHAILLDPATKAFLAGLLDPSPEQAAKGEDDLAVFKQDKAFRDLFGLPAS